MAGPAAPRGAAEGQAREPQDGCDAMVGHEHATITANCALMQPHVGKQSIEHSQARSLRAAPAPPAAAAAATAAASPGCSASRAAPEVSGWPESSSWRRWRRSDWAAAQPAGPWPSAAVWRLGRCQDPQIPRQDPGRRPQLVQLARAAVRGCERKGRAPGDQGTLDWKSVTSRKCCGALVWPKEQVDLRPHRGQVICWREGPALLNCVGQQLRQMACGHEAAQEHAGLCSLSRVPRASGGSASRGI